MSKHDPASINLEADEIKFWGSNEHNDGGMRISWSSDIGFGQLDIVRNKDGKLVAYTECMDKGEDKDFTKETLSKLLEQIEIVE